MFSWNARESVNVNWVKIPRKRYFFLKVDVRKNKPCLVKLLVVDCVVDTHKKHLHNICMLSRSWKESK